LAFVDYNGGFKLSNNSSLMASYGSVEYKILVNYLKNGIQKLLTSTEITNALMEMGKFKSKDDLKKVFEWGNGPEIEITRTVAGGISEYDNYSDILNISTSFMTKLSQAKTPEQKQIVLFAIVASILHETVHYGIDQYYDPDNKIISGEDKVKIVELDEKINGKGNEPYKNELEPGNVFEHKAWGQFIGSSNSNVDENIKSCKEIINKKGKKNTSIPQIQTERRPMTIRR